jgi:hypothetical protein
MADAIGPANISHKSDQRIIRVFSASLSGDRGITAAAAEGPWSYPLTLLQGLSQTLVLPEATKSTRRKRYVSGSRLQIAMTEMVRELGGNQLSHSLSRNALRHLALRRI